MRSAVRAVVRPRAALTSETITSATQEAGNGSAAGSSPSAPPFVVPAEASAPPDTYQKVGCLFSVETAPRLAKRSMLRTFNSLNETLRNWVLDCKAVLHR